MLKDWNKVPNDNDTIFSVSNKERIKRIEICESCEFLSSLKTCKKCNCFMPVKTWLKNKTCPIKKW